MMTCGGDGNVGVDGFGTGAAASITTIQTALRTLTLDPYTYHHSERIAIYALALGEHLQLDDDDLAALRCGSYFHDVGKTEIPDAVLEKPGLLTAAEFDQVKQHPVIGDRLCGSFGAIVKTRAIVRHHHERLDGSGYPDGLAGDQIPLLAQIVTIADIYDALTTDRPYRGAVSPERAFQELRREAARGWRDPNLVEQFITVARTRLRAQRSSRRRRPRAAAATASA